MSAFQNFHMVVLRSMYRFNYKEPAKDSVIQDSIKILPPFIVFRLKRLIYLPRLMKHAPLALKAAIAILQNNKESWYNLIVDDLLWLASKSVKMSGFTPPDFASTEFQDFLFSRAWKSTVYDACESSLSELSTTRVPTAIVSTKCTPVQCSVCSIWLKNSHQLSGHLGRVHKYRHISRIFADRRGTCSICLKGFHNRVRLIHHLRQNSYTCLMQYEAYNLSLSSRQVSELDLEDRLATAATKRSGLSKLHASSPVVQFSGPKRPLISSCLTSMHDGHTINAVP